MGSGIKRLVKALGGTNDKMVTGLCFDNGGRRFYSCSDDGLMKGWTTYPVDEGEVVEGELATSHGPTAMFRSPTVGSLKSINHHRSKSQFVTARESSADVWNLERSVPVQSYRDTIPYRGVWLGSVLWIGGGL